MSILNKLLHKCNYKCGGKIKKYDTGGAFAHAGMNNDEKAAYMKSNRDLAMQRAAMPEKHGTLLVMDKDKGVVASIYTGSHTPKKYTFNSGVPERTTTAGSLKMPEGHTIDNTTLTRELLLSKAEEALLKSGRTDISAEDLADLAEAQKRAEGYYPGSTAYETNNPFNVGNTGKSKNYLPNLDTGLSTYYDLILGRYLVNGKKPEDLVENFVNADGNRYAKDPNYEKNVSAFLKEVKAKKSQTGGVYLPPIKKKEEDLSNSIKEREVFSVESKPATMVNRELNPTVLAPVEITARKYGWNRDIEKYRNEQRERSPIGQLFHHKSEERIKRKYVPRLLDNLDKNTEDLALDKVESDFINKYGTKKDKDFYKTVNPDDYLTQDQKWKKAQIRAANETALDNLPRFYGVDLGNAMNMLKTTKDFIQGNWLEAGVSLIKIPGGKEVDYAVNLAKDNPSGYSAKDMQDKYFYQPQLYMNNPLIPLKIGVQRMLDPTLPKLSKVNNPELQKFITYYMTQGHDYKSALNAYNNVKQRRDIVTPTSPKTNYKDGKIVYGEKKTDKLMDFVKGLGTQRQPYK